MYAFATANSQHLAEHRRLAALPGVETSIVGAHFDPETEANFYVRQNLSGQRIAIRIQNYEFDRDCGPLTDEKSRRLRRDYVSRRLALGPHVDPPPCEGPTVSFVVLERGGFSISPEALDACFAAMMSEVAELKRQVAELVKESHRG